MEASRISELLYKPLGFEENLRGVLTTVKWTRDEFQSKQTIINELVNDLTEQLRKTGLSEERIGTPQRFKVAYAPVV